MTPEPCARLILRAARRSRVGRLRGEHHEDSPQSRPEATAERGIAGVAGDARSRSCGPAAPPAPGAPHATRPRAHGSRDTSDVPTRDASVSSQESEQPHVLNHSSTPEGAVIGGGDESTNRTSASWSGTRCSSRRSPRKRGPMVPTLRRRSCESRTSSFALLPYTLSTMGRASCSRAHSTIGSKFGLAGLTTNRAIHTPRSRSSWVEPSRPT